MTRVYDTLNNGVYKAGFATTQAAYEEAVDAAVRHAGLAGRRASASRVFCAATHLTEADIRLFTTLVRFDAVYHGHFKCNIRRIVDYRNLWAYTRDIYQLPGVARDGEFSAHQAALLHEPRADQPDRDRPGGAGAGLRGSG